MADLSRGVGRPGACILHLDLDAFFAAVEQRDKPSLRGRPVVVGGVDGRGVVATASYEARRFGVHSAMATAQARRLLPAGAAYLCPRFEAYRTTSAVVMAVLAELSPLVEQVSIDEAYVDLAAGGHDPSEAALGQLAGDVRERVAAATGGVTASVGIGTSKLVAKTASDLRKPDAQTVVPAGGELAMLHPLPVTKLGGVGPATEQKLRSISVATVGDLYRVEPSTLVQLFGTAHGGGLHRLARAQDDRVVVPHREAKSVSAEDTFPTDVTAVPRLHAEIDALAARVAQRLRDAGTAGRTVTLKVRRHDFTTATRSATLSHASDEVEVIAATARRLLGLAPTEGGVRLLGVGVSGLRDFVQAELFGPTGSTSRTTDGMDDADNRPQTPADHPAGDTRG
ncbi:MAG: DNA polymerase IV, partial [Actinomycetota bacterium]|nr:DNA polymerase IV [Actinomycetota bacterium]